MGNKRAYFPAFFCVLVWGSTFVSTKVILAAISPIELMLYRFILAYLTLFLVKPKIHTFSGIRDELLFFAMGVTGGSGYYLFEHVALDIGNPVNVSFLVSVSPILTVLLASLFLKGEKLRLWIIPGSLAAAAGCFLVITNGVFDMRFSLLGDLLSLGASLSWAVYSLLVRRMGERFDGLYITRRVLFYALLTTLPMLPFFKADWDLSVLLNWKVSLNLLFLSAAAMSLCYLFWNRTILALGAVRANNLLYLDPFVTLLFARLTLGDPITPAALLGGALVILGVYTAQNGIKLPFLKEAKAE